MIPKIPEIEKYQGDHRTPSSPCSGPEPGAISTPRAARNSTLGATLLPDPGVDLLTIKPPFVEDFLSGYLSLSGKLVKRPLTDLQVSRKLFDRHNGTDHVAPPL